MELQRALLRPTSVRILAISSRLPIVSSRLSSTAPATIVDRGFWKSLVPKPLRKENREQLKARSSKEWNPATFFIAIFLLIGSMSIQMIALRNSFDRYMRQSEVRIGQLREVVERIQAGEQVDVEKALGTGDAKREADWEELLKAIEREDAYKKAQKEKLKHNESQAKEAAVTHHEEHDSTIEAKPRTSSLGNFF